MSTYKKAAQTELQIKPCMLEIYTTWTIYDIHGIRMYQDLSVDG